MVARREPLLLSLLAAALLAAAGPAQAQEPQEEPWAPEPDAPAPGAATPPFEAWPPGKPFGVHLVVGLQMGDRTGLLAGAGLRVQRFFATYRFWAHEGDGGGDSYTQFEGLQVGGFVLPRPWGGAFVAGAFGDLKYRGYERYSDPMTLVPGFTAHGTALELEAGVTMLAGGFTNGAGVSVAVVLPLDSPDLPPGVKLSPPTVVFRLELNPVLMLLFMR